jgi:hypothetical protein
MAEKRNSEKESIHPIKLIPIKGFVFALKPIVASVRISAWHHFLPGVT